MLCFIEATICYQFISGFYTFMIKQGGIIIYQFSSFVILGVQRGVKMLFYVDTFIRDVVVGMVDIIGHGDQAG